MLPTVAALTAALADRYRIERELGAGGMATVYLAQDVKHDRKVALKVLKPELAAVLGAERFVVEIKTTASLSHPHILPLFDSGAAEGFLFYVMPYVEGETLREKLNREKQFGIDEAVRITREVGDALDYAHRHGVIHRDIKPENILLHDGRPMVADFGIALALSAAAGGRMTETGLSLGTPHYMSPEQATAEKEITARSDVYSLASVLYEMLTGNPPHTGATAQQIIMKIIAEPVEAVTKFRKSVPANVAAAVAMALEKLPADRFESAKAFVDALANPAFTTVGVTGAQSGVFTTRGGVAPRLFWATASVAVAALVVAAVGWLRPEPLAEVSRFSVFLPDSQELTGPQFRLAVSPDGRTIVYSGPGAAGTNTRLYVRRLDELLATPLAGTERAYNPAISPDGKRVAFVVGSPRALRTMSLAGGPATTLTDSLVDLGGVSWGTDGYIYYDGKLEGDGVARIRESGGTPETVTRPDSANQETYHFLPSALPDGRGILFVTRRAGAFEVGVFDARTGRHKVLTPGLRPRYASSGHLVFGTEEGVLMAARFDLERLELEGDPVPIAENVATRSRRSRVDIEISTTGLLAYAAGSTSGFNRELVWVDRKGVVSPVDPAWSGRVSGRAALSPDGRRVALTLSGEPPQIWVKELDRGPATKLADAGMSPDWTSDGRSLIFAVRRGRAGARGPADGSTLPTEFGVGTEGFGTPAPSRDGQWIVYQSTADLYAMRTTGDTAARELLRSPAYEALPSLSPDGRWLLYTSDETGRFEAYVRPFPDTKSAKRQLSANGGFSPRWSPNGRDILFLDEAQQLVSLPVTFSPSITAGIPQVLFSAEPFDGFTFPFDVHPDGKRFLFSRPVGGGSVRSDELILVQNFFAELRAKVGR